MAIYAPDDAILLLIVSLSVAQRFLCVFVRKSRLVIDPRQAKEAQRQRI
jgi:hypothetical protein